MSDAALETDTAAVNLPDNAVAKRQCMSTEARRIQLLVLKDAENVKLKPFIRAQLARAYRELGEFRLRLAGKGPPKAVDMSSHYKHKTTASNGFTETPAQKPGKVKPAVVASDPSQSKTVTD